MGFASAEIYATIDFLTPSLTLAGSWVLEDLLSGSVAPSCTAKSFKLDGLGVDIGWETRESRHRVATMVVVGLGVTYELYMGLWVKRREHWLFTR